MARQLLSPPSHPEMLGRLGRYEVERLIGSGGMGIVFKGFDTELHRPVAIKVLAPHLAGSGAARQRFAREARAAAAVVHEHVVAIHNVESDGASPFLVMQFVAGESLQARLDRQGPLDLCEVLRIGRQTAAGLAAAHAQGLVHRDVKPSNILLEHGVERALLTDFGLARAADDASLTHTGHLPGTPHYMSPEQARGEPIDLRSDVFSLGSVMYAMATGRPPFRAETGLAVLRRITDERPRPLVEVNAELPAWFQALVAKLHAKSPAERFQSADEVATLLEQCLAHVRQPAAVPLPEVLQKKESRRRLAWPLGVGAGLIAVALAAFAFLPPAKPGRSGPERPAPQGDADSQREVPPGDPGLLSPSETDWDAAAREIESLDADAAALAAEIDCLWKSSPSPSTRQERAADDADNADRK
jgi:serine/threonine-protein kinase